MSTNGSVVDRRQYLLVSLTWNGIDYVEVATADQTTLRVHFLNTVPVAGTLGTASGSPPSSEPVTITGGEVIASVAVLPIDEATDWSFDSEARPVLTVRVKAPGDFSTYQLRVVSTVLDPFFAEVPFSFKAGCPSDFDCQQPSTPCPPPDTLDVPIDYLAKDFRSFVQALSEFSTQRYPAWLERSEADLGMVVMEVLAAIGDELSYFQDRIAGESLLATATQPLSLLHLARLVDYEPAPATVATVLLQLDVVDGTTAITNPVHCQALAAGGGLIDFEVGQGLADPATGGLAALSYPVDAGWNRYRSGAANLVPYWWDESQRCLSAGSTSLDVQGWGFGLEAGQSLLIDTAGPTSADPPLREVVVTGPAPQQLVDPVFGVELTRVTLAAPTTQDHDLTRTIYAGNLVPATQGLRTTETFAIPGGGPGSTPAALVRVGANWTPEDPTPDFFYCLGSRPLAWIAGAGTDADTVQSARPEIVLMQAPNASSPLPWSWVRWLLDAGPGDAAFTLTPEQYSPVLSAAGLTWFDYDGGDGTTIRFGNGTFGSLPAAGLTFQAQYRVGCGAAGNVPADTIIIVAADGAASPVVSCTNPFPASGGTDAETPQQIRDRAPQAFQGPLRVVRPPDYVAAAQSLPWVQQAGTTFRWTGSWLTVLSAADPVATEEPTLAEVATLTDLLNRRRLAGYESYVLPPRYVSVDLQITLCANPAYFAADVEAAVLTALRPGKRPGGAVGFFDHTRWGFGTPLECSALLAAIQSCPGVDGVSQLLFRQRGVQSGWTSLPETLTFGADQILRVDDDPSRPEAGSLQVIVNGGKA
jgi:hypothetical protein